MTLCTECVIIRLFCLQQSLQSQERC
ncbi:uncharacterized protein [Blastocystis hominis]|uniref:Uncharacterized protein n=1 Tax=Blastocystis hominis TaxID=12968 RepID=D8LVM6_BLAHO|nr:uncharacterized protein [Blastocystis hominis]CBK19865.2 unnamed protein product [Blastocystis hominis]|eukprot:XP_012893913.1 uncharacterized protein [Blastocystis hominis]